MHSRASLEQLRMQMYAHLLNFIASQVPTWLDALALEHDWVIGPVGVLDYADCYAAASESYWRDGWVGIPAEYNPMKTVDGFINLLCSEYAIKVFTAPEEMVAVNTYKIAPTLPELCLQLWSFNQALLKHCWNPNTPDALAHWLFRHGYRLSGWVQEGQEINMARWHSSRATPLLRVSGDHGKAGALFILGLPDVPYLLDSFSVLEYLTQDELRTTVTWAQHP